MDGKQLYDLKQERAELVKSLRDHMEEFQDKLEDGDGVAKRMKMEARFDEINAVIEREEKQLERERLIGEGKKEAVKATNDQRQMFAKALGGEPHHIREYQNSFTLGDNDQAGSLTAPMEFVQELIKGLDDFLWMRQICRGVGPIGAGQSLGFPYRSTDATSAEWTTEVAAAGEETTLEYGRREFKPYRLAKLIKLSKTLMRHAPMAERTIMDEMIYRIGTAQENAYLNGSGTNQPLGVFTASANGIPTTRDVATGNTATTVSFDGLINAKYSIKEQYIRGASWIMHRDLAKTLALIKDTNGQYIWQPAVALGQPDTLLGHVAHMSEYAPNTYTAGKYAAVFGNFFEGYWYCDADTVYIQVLNELFAVNNQIGYLVEYFGDGMPVLPEAFARVTMAAA